MTHDQNGSKPIKPSTEAPSRDEDIQIIDDNDVEESGDLGNEFDDPEGWMSENANYWLNLPDIQPLTRQAWVRYKIKELVELLWLLKYPKASPWDGERIPESEWIRLYETVFGPAMPTAMADVHAVRQAPGAKNKAASTPREKSGRDGVVRQRLGEIVLLPITAKAI